MNNIIKGWEALATKALTIGLTLTNHHGHIRRHGNISSTMNSDTQISNSH